MSVRVDSETDQQIPLIAQEGPPSVGQIDAPSQLNTRSNYDDSQVVQVTGETTLIKSGDHNNSLLDQVSASSLLNPSQSMKLIQARSIEETVRLGDEEDQLVQEPLVAEFNKDFVDRRADPVEGGTLCDVCYETYRAEDFFSLSCGHSFCVNCQADNLRTKISNGMAMKLPCMQTGCKKQYTLEQIQTFCSAKIQKQYDVIQQDVKVGKSRKIKWCARPGCENTITRPGCCCKRRAICSCGFETCFKCGDPYHEANCQVSGEAGLLLHNINPRVAKCPNCKSPIYKISGCNHMTCNRCSKDWCWICRRVTDDPYGHFDPGAIFGCAGMQEIPQSVILWTILLTLQLVLTPFIILGKLSYGLGSKTECFEYIDDSSVPGVAFFVGIFLMPIMLIPTAIVTPIVIIYRLYVILSMLARHFLFCCCC